MDDADIKRDREVIAAATPGPWTVGSRDEDYAATLEAQPIMRDTGTPSGPRESVVIPFGRAFSDARFIAAARTRWPTALDALEAARRERDDAKRDAAIAIGLPSDFSSSAAQRNQRVAAVVADQKTRIATLDADLAAERAAHAATESARRALECELSAAVARAQRAEVKLALSSPTTALVDAEADRDCWKARAEVLAKVAAFATEHPATCGRHKADRLHNKGVRGVPSDEDDCTCGLDAARKEAGLK